MHSKIFFVGNPPPPRSGCIVLPTPENKILVYGGYSKEKIKKDVDKGHVHTDMFLLSPESKILFLFYTGYLYYTSLLLFYSFLENDQTGLKWKWSIVKQGGITVSPRCSATAVLVQPHLAYMFGGVYDEEDNEEDLYGYFFNDLVAFNLTKLQWHTGKYNTCVEIFKYSFKSNYTYK